jgi:hypothetical protein
VSNIEWEGDDSDDCSVDPSSGVEGGVIVGRDHVGEEDGAGLAPEVGASSAPSDSMDDIWPCPTSREFVLHCCEPLPFLVPQQVC